jgi:protein-tyrosine phosphatase
MSSQTPYQVLCVCLGNICRSPTAEVVLRQHCDAGKLSVYIDSAGTSNYHPGKAPDLRSQQHAQLRGYDLSRLRARQIQLQDFMQFDLILAMDHDNLHDIALLAEEAKQQWGTLRAQIALMSAHDPQYPNQDVPDPYYGGATGFERVLDQCESSSRAWVAYFQQNSQV